MEYPHKVQKRLLKQLIEATKHTEWGRTFNYRSIRTPEDFAHHVPIQDYESLKPYIQRMMHGEKDVLWTGQVNWYSKSSGTTSDKSKFIPVSRQNLKHCHIRGSWDTMTLTYHNMPEARNFELKSMVMGGSLQTFEPFPKTMFGDVSAIMIQNMPYVGRQFYIPDIEGALLDNWEKKLELLAQAGIKEPNVVMIGGVPTWTVVLFRRMLELTGKQNMLEIWPKYHKNLNIDPDLYRFLALCQTAAKILNRL